MDSNVLIVLILVVGVVVIVFLLRDRITAVLARGSAEKREGEFKVEAAPPQAKGGNDAATKYGVDIRGNKSVGSSKIQVSRPDVRVADNTSIGESEIKVTDDKKPRK